jgi:hypothetical protein
VARFSHDECMCNDLEGIVDLDNSAKTAE